MTYKRQAGYTPPVGAYPPYLNFSELSDGAIQVTLRQPSPDGGQTPGLTGCLRLPASEFAALLWRWQREGSGDLAPAANPSLAELAGVVAQLADVVDDMARRKPCLQDTRDLASRAQDLAGEFSKAEERCT